MTAVVTTLLVCFGMLELGLRITGLYQDDGSLFGCYVKGRVTYQLRPGFEGRAGGNTPYSIHIDAAGHRVRSRDAQPPADGRYVLLAGSSDVFGEGLDYDQCTAGVAEAALQKHGLGVVNLGVPGHHVLEQTETVADYLAAAAHKPKTVVLVLNHYMVAAFDDTQKDTQVVLGNLFGRWSWVHAVPRIALGCASAGYCFFRDTLAKLLHSGGAAKPDYARLFADFSRDHRLHQPQTKAALEQILLAMVRRVRESGAEVRIVYSPSSLEFQVEELIDKHELDGQRFDTTYFPQVIRGFCQDHDVPYLEFRETLQALVKAGKPLHLKFDAHFNAETCAHLGERLAAWLLESGK